MLDHWNPTADNETCGAKTLNSARLEALDSTQLGCASMYVFQRTAIVNWLNRLCRIFASLIGFNTNRLDSALPVCTHSCGRQL